MLWALKRTVSKRRFLRVTATYKFWLRDNKIKKLITHSRFEAWNISIAFANSCCANASLCQCLYFSDFGEIKEKNGVYIMLTSRTKPKQDKTYHANIKVREQTAPRAAVCSRATCPLFAANSFQRHLEYSFLKDSAVNELIQTVYTYIVCKMRQRSAGNV